jgi:hypothetical protein
VPCTQAVLSGGQLYLATSTLVSDKSSPSYSRRPAISWAQLSVSTATQGTDTCSQSRAGVASRQAWDFSKDFSKDWGHAVSRYTPASTCFRWCSVHTCCLHVNRARGGTTEYNLCVLPQAAAGALAGSGAASNSSDRVVRAAGLLLPVLGAAQFAAVGLSQLGKRVLWPHSSQGSMVSR